MLMIRTSSILIRVDNYEEFSIYAQTYNSDQYGNRKEDGEYIFGDIVIETGTKRYIITSVYEADIWVSEMLDRIAESYQKEHIFLDLNTITVEGACFDDGNPWSEFKVEVI